MPVRPSPRAALAAAALVITTSAVALALQDKPRSKEPHPGGDVPIIAPAQTPELPAKLPPDIFDSNQKPDNRITAPPAAEEMKPPPDGEVQVLIPIHPSWIEEAKVKPPPPIPDDPPPHEGAMITYPYIVEPPDLLRIEVLESAPGRPITGPDRLVMPNGKVNLEFFGDMEVAGLTTDQIKVKAIIHLHRYLSDVALGIVKVDESGDCIRDSNGAPVVIPPADSDRLFVEVTSFNSKVYYVQGAVDNPGRLPWTGHETVLDALNWSGGFASNVDMNNIRLIRPARGGKPKKVYPIDYKAIVEDAEITKNYQLFPGDRLVIGRKGDVPAPHRFERISETPETDRPAATPSDPDEKAPPRRS